ncbi:MAG: transketolase C-terminal domain-containing protein, partial [Deltaproteobacteria bacterium]|nr:transketolase C-terminal domain-containing protein [Deltaproteobacteria bacterium]
NFSIFLPADPNQTDRIVRYVTANPGNHFVGMGRSKIPVITDKKGKPFFGPDYKFEPGKADWLRRGKDGCIISYGAMIPRALAATDILQKKYGLSVSLLNMASIKPLDRRSVIKAAQTGVLVTVEDHNIYTGLGKIAGDVLAEEGIKTHFAKLGVTGYGASGVPDDLYRMQGLDPVSIARTVKSMVKK